MPAPDPGPETDGAARYRGNACTVSHDPAARPGQPHAASRRDGNGTARAASPAALLDAIRSDYASRPSARLAIPEGVA